MRQLNIKLTDRQHGRLRRYASRRRTPVAWLIKDYVDSLVDEDAAAPVRAHEPTQLAARPRPLKAASRIRLNKLATLHRALVRRRLGPSVRGHELRWTAQCVTPWISEARTSLAEG